MSKKVNTAVCVMVLLFVPFIYFYGVYAWKQAELSQAADQLVKGKNVYFVCFSSALYALSIACFMLAKPTLLKIVTSSVGAFCSVVLFQEVMYGNKQWTEWSYWSIVIMALSYFIFYSVIEKFKKRVNE